MPLLYTVTRLTVGTGLRLGWRPAVHGLRRLPRHGGAILAGNHLSVADELFLAAVVPRDIAFWAKAEYFTGTGLRGRLTRAAVRAVGAIPVERSGGRAALAAFDAALPVLRAGGLVAVYPEGTRSPDGRLYRGRTGVARLAHAAGVPVIPVGVLGTDNVRPGSVTLRFARPMDVTGHIAAPTDYRRVTDELMARIQRLTGQEYVPTYAPRPPHPQLPPGPPRNS